MAVKGLICLDGQRAGGGGGSKQGGGGGGADMSIYIREVQRQRDWKRGKREFSWVSEIKRVGHGGGGGAGGGERERS